MLALLASADPTTLGRWFKALANRGSVVGFSMGQPDRQSARDIAARLPPGQDGGRPSAERAHDYLLAKKRYLDYPTALNNGWPLATGVIEGACRSLVKDRMDITGARWGLEGAEAILKLRAIKANHDFDNYWQYHLAQERRRVHEARYAAATIPTSAAQS